MSRSEPSVAESWLDRRLQVLIGPIAHGGHCVARYEGRVVFVRHCLPGELVIAQVTEDRGGSFCRADAVEVLTGAPDRVQAPCEYAHPGGCGGCDFQHVSLAGQRALKGAVVSEQLARLAGIDRAVTVQPLQLPDARSADSELADSDGLGWRRRIRFAVTPVGELGLRVHRSQQVLPVTHCPLGAPGVGDSDAPHKSWPGLTELEVAVDDDGAVAMTGFVSTSVSNPSSPRTQLSAKTRPSANRRGRRTQQRPVLTQHRVSGPDELHYRVGGRRFRIRPTGFWQTHPLAAQVFTETVLAAAQLTAGERALDLYSGAGLFTAALADAVGSGGEVLGLEGDALAVAAARENLADQTWASVRHGAVSAQSVTALLDELAPAVVVLDPPRTGAGAEIVRAILGSGARTVIYVACDPAALARDLGTAAELGWRLTELAAFDAFPMTHHVECIAVLGSAP